MGKLFLECTGDSEKVYQCRYCGTALTTVEHLLSKSFHSRAGKAYLFERVYNVAIGRPEERLMTTGLHSVADINCISCYSSCGWKYLVAQDRSQKYKEGKFILERAKLIDSSKRSRQSTDSQDAPETNETDSESEDPCT